MSRRLTWRNSAQCETTYFYCSLRAVGCQQSREELWRQFFADPSQWWDHTSDKVNPRYPDYKHKTTGSPLWIEGRSNPPWVKAELSGMVPGAVPRSPFSWNMVIERCLKSKQERKALEIFQQMQVEGVKPNSFTFVMAANSCAGLAALEDGRRVHEQAMRGGFECDLFVANSLVDMYGKCGTIDDAWEVFEKMSTRDVVSWTALIAGCVKCQVADKALKLFRQMQVEGVQPNAVTFVAVCNACASVAGLQEGRELHNMIVKAGCENNVFVGSSLVDMYSKCGSIEDAWKVFSNMPRRDVVAWTAMLSGLVKCEQSKKALEMFRQMEAEGVRSNSLTFVAIINACASLALVEEGRRVHRKIIDSGFESDYFVAHSLVDMYSKCGSIEDAWSAFNKLARRDVVSWNSMLSVCVKHDHGQKALDLFKRMQAEEVKPDATTFVRICNACANLAALEEGKRIHFQVIESGCQADVFVSSSLVDMYAKCGSIEDAWRVFNNTSTRNSVSWNAMIGGLGMHGHGKEAIQLFEDMYRERVEMDMVTFVSLLTACSHAGLVDEGLQYFRSMSSVYGVSPTIQHYVCVVDLLGRAGRLVEAEDLIMVMSCEVNRSETIIMWRALLGACRNQGNYEIGERVARRVLELDPDHSSGYVLLSNIYAAAGQLESSDEIQELGKESGVKDLPGHTWIELNNQMHTFVSDEREHVQIGEIHEELQRLHWKMEEAGSSLYSSKNKFPA